MDYFASLSTLFFSKFVSMKSYWPNPFEACHCSTRQLFRYKLLLFLLHGIRVIQGLWEPTPQICAAIDMHTSSRKGAKSFWGFQSWDETQTHERASVEPLKRSFISSWSIACMTRKPYRLGWWSRKWTGVRSASEEVRRLPIRWVQRHRLLDDINVTSQTTSKVSPLQSILKSPYKVSQSQQTQK